MIITGTGMSIVRVIACLVCCTTVVTAQDTAYVRGHYRKKEEMVRMRDGVRLFTSIYEPADSSRSYPVLLLRTPYGVGPYGNAYPDVLGPSFTCTVDGYIFVYQDVRGRMMSEGNFVDVRPYRPGKRSSHDIDETSDTYDTIEWIVHHLRHCNGNVGMWGVSYPGFYASMGLIDAHPALKAVSPQAPIGDWFMGDDVHHNGVMMLMDTFGFFSGFGRKRDGRTTQALPGYRLRTDDAYNFYLHLGKRADAGSRYFHDEVPFWDDVVRNETYNGFWQSRGIAQYFRNTAPAVLVVAGWFDAEDFSGSISTFESIQNHNPQNSVKLVVGPWSHGDWAWGRGTSLGALHFPQVSSDAFHEQIELPFFRHYLKDGGSDTLATVLAYCTGSNDWRSFERWPPAGLHDSIFYFSAGGTLSARRPGAPAGFDEYESDPGRPVPYTAAVGRDRTTEYMVEDQRFAARRPDVLVYRTEQLRSSLTIAGPVMADLFFSSSGTDADVVVKLIDVFPDTATDAESPCGVRLGGYQMLVRGDIMRAKFRNGFTHAEPLTPGAVARITFPLRDVLHTFLPGHSIMVQVQSSWFPLFDLNPQQFMDVYEAVDSDYKKANDRVYRSGDAASCILLHVLPQLQQAGPPQR
jgi:uncharacterized protein